MALCNVEERKSQSLSLEDHRISLSDSLVDSDILANPGLLNLSCLLNLVLVPLGLGSQDALLGHLSLLNGIFVVIGEVNAAELEKYDLAVDILLKAHIKVILHLSRNIRAHCEEIIGGEAGSGITNGIDCHAQQDIFHLIAILSVDGIDLFGQDFVLEGDFEHQSQTILGAAGYRRESTLLGVL